MHVWKVTGSDRRGFTELEVYATAATTAGSAAPCAGAATFVSACWGNASKAGYNGPAGAMSLSCWAKLACLYRGAR